MDETSPTTIADIVAGSSNFDILLRALQATGLAAAAADTGAELTVFAPSDVAFAALAQDLGFTGDTSDEDAVFQSIADTLADLDDDGDPIPLLTDILEFHISPGVQDLNQVAAADSVATLQDDATVSVDGTTLIDNDPDLANPAFVQADIQASNGIVHTLDRVLAPIDLPAPATEAETPSDTIAGIVAGSEDFEVLLQAVEATGLTGSLANADADLTTFAPTDTAFAELAQDFGFTGDTNDANAVFQAVADALSGLSDTGDPIPLLTDILRYHISPGAQTLEQVAAQDSVATLLDGTTFAPQGRNLVDNEPDLDDPTLVTTDVGATNGIVHVLDRVLIPSDLPGNDDAEVLRGTDGDDTLTAGLGDETLRGEAGDDTLDGGAGADALFGGAGADTLRVGTGDMVAGGVGADTIEAAALDGDFVWRDPTPADDTLLLPDRALSAEQVRVTNAALTSDGDAVLRFDLDGDGAFAADEPDVTLAGRARAAVDVTATDAGGTAIQLQGPALPLTELTAEDQVNALYVGYFGRTPDAGGREFWTGEYQDALAAGRAPGRIVEDISESFRLSQEAQGQFDFLDPTASADANQAEIEGFVIGVYQQLFNRAPSNEGVATWADEIAGRLDQGINIGDIIVDIAAGAQNGVTVQPIGADAPREVNDAATLRNKIAAADSLADRLDDGSLSLGRDISFQASADIVDDVGASFDSLEVAEAEIAALFTDQPDAAMLG